MQYIYQFSNFTNYPSIPQEISHVLGYNLRTFLGVLSFFGIGLVFLVVGILLWKPPKLKVNMFKFTTIIFVIIGLGAIVGASFLAYDTQKRIQTWVEVEGTVVDSKVIEARVSRPRGGSSMGYG